MKIKKLLMLPPTFLALGLLVGCKSKVWYLDTNYLKGLNEQDVGTIKKISVNGVDHQVRLIGIDHDIDASGNKIHTTWEFANLISDSDGNSLAYQWNDAADPSNANFNYTNSTIRFALTGEGNNWGKQNDPFKKDQILVAQKGKYNWCEETYNKPIISMLPKDLVNVLKTVKKTVGTVAVESHYRETEYTDKLFMLSGIEMGNRDAYDEGCGAVYQYYKDDVSKQKRQVNSEFGSFTVIPSGSGQTRDSDIDNYAGENEGLFGANGGNYWLRSPYSYYSATVFDSGEGACCCTCFGTFDYMPSDICAYGIAPAFCI